MFNVMKLSVKRLLRLDLAHSLLLAVRALLGTRVFIDMSESALSYSICMPSIYSLKIIFFLLL